MSKKKVRLGDFSSLKKIMRAARRDGLPALARLKPADLERIRRNHIHPRCLRSLLVAS
jgi:hypothetical protein